MVKMGLRIIVVRIMLALLIIMVILLDNNNNNYNNVIITPTFPSFQTFFKKHLHPASSFSSYHTRKQIFDLPRQVRAIFTSLIDLYPHHNHIRHNISLNTRHTYHFQPINTLSPGRTVNRQFRSKHS